MATDLIDEKDFTLTRFKGRGAGKILYQITQMNEYTKRHEYVCLSEKQIEQCYRKIQNNRIFGVVGNRNGFTYDFVKSILDRFPINQNDIIVSGGATGVDSYARRYAEENGLCLITFYPNPKVKIPERFFERNIKVAFKLDELIAFNKKRFSGTTHTINRTKELNKKVTTIGE